MKRALALALSTGAMVVAMGTAKADWSVGAGFENFRWKESTSPSVKESGLRWALDLTWAQSKDPGLSVAYNGKFYVGNVDYTGAFLGSATPISSSTHYRGFSNEIQSIYRMPQNATDVVLGLGWDHWNRELSSIQEENWDVLYARLGMNFNSLVRQGFLASAGIKYPVYVRENANLTAIGFGQNPRLRPKGDFSFYTTLGYRISPAWDVMAFYDGYRFKQSNTVAVTSGGGMASVWQPKSQQDVFGMKVQHNF